jgi:hypothetical protein
LEDVPNIAGAAVVARMLAGQVKLGKRPNPRKIGITVDLLREMVVGVEYTDDLRPVGKALLKATSMDYLWRLGFSTRFCVRF